MCMRVAIPGYENYEIDNDGIVYNKGKPKKSLFANDGRSYVTLWSNKKGYQEKKYISYLLALTFIDEDVDGKVVCFKDGNPLNLDISNLYWGSRKQRHKDVYAYKLANKDPSDYRVKKLLDRSKSVYKLNPDDLSVIESYPNLVSAADAMDIPPVCIANACYNVGKTCCHYRWCFDYQFGDIR